MGPPSRLQFSRTIKPKFHHVVSAESTLLVRRGCPIPWAGESTQEAGLTATLCHGSSFERSRKRVIYDARPPNVHRKHMEFSMGSVTAVAGYGWQNCCQGPTDDRSGISSCLVASSVLTLYGVSWEGIDYVWTVLSLRWGASPYVYHTSGEARERYLRSRGVPALAWIDACGWLVSARHAVLLRYFSGRRRQNPCMWPCWYLACAGTIHLPVKPCGTNGTWA